MITANDLEQAPEPEKQIPPEGYDWKSFDVSFENWHNGDENFTSNEYKKLFKYASGKCNENGEYTIDCYNGRYTVRTKAEAEQLRSDAMSAKEKAVLLAEQKRFERNRLLTATDKLMLPDYPITEAEREQYKQYRQYLRDFPEAPGFPDLSILSFSDWLNNNSLA